jgi:hypothetical protein
LGGSIEEGPCFGQTREVESPLGKAWRSKKWSARLVFSVGAIVGLWLLGTGPASASEGCFTSKINAARGSLGPLATDGTLVTIARRHSQRMANSGSIYHNSNLAKEVPPGWKSLGENVGMGPTCDDIHQAFMNSASHRANILDPDFNFVGVGVVVAGDGTIFVTEVFMQKEASQPAQNAPAPTKSSTAKPAAPRAPARPRAEPAPAPAPAPVEAPAPPPPPPPGERVKGNTSAYLDAGTLAELLPSADQQGLYDAYLRDLELRRKDTARAMVLSRQREHGLFSRFAALISGAFSATV